MNDLKCCPMAYLNQMHGFVVVDEYLDKLGICAHCYWDRPLEGKDTRIRKYYFVKKDGNSYICRTELSTGSGFNIIVVSQSNGKVFVGIERLSCFNFAGWDALMPPNQSALYIAEKLCCSEQDAYELSEIFTMIHEKIKADK